jgi:hypothetical protein
MFVHFWNHIRSSIGNPRRAFQNPSGIDLLWNLRS